MEATKRTNSRVKSISLHSHSQQKNCVSSFSEECSLSLVKLSCSLVAKIAAQAIKDCRYLRHEE